MIDVLHTADRVEMSPFDYTYYDIGDMALDERTRPDLISLLRTTDNCGSFPAGRRADHTFFVAIYDGIGHVDAESAHYLYDSRTGMVGENKEMTYGYVVPERFRQALSVAPEKAEQQKVKEEAAKRVRDAAAQAKEQKEQAEEEKRLRSYYISHHPGEPAPPMFRPIYRQHIKLNDSEVSEYLVERITIYRELEYSSYFAS